MILMRRAATLMVALLFVVLISAIWVENDSYRIAAALLVLSGIGIYLVEDFKPSIGWMGIACIGWALYVGIRYIVIYRSGATHSLGASEGIYLLPAFYITVGYMMFLYRRLLWPLVLLWLAVSLVLVVATVDWLSFHDGAFHQFLFMNNTIHSSVAGGLIVIGAINLAAYAGKTLRTRPQRLLLEGLAFALVAATFVGLYGAKSKGVWLALAGASLVQFLMSVSVRVGRPALLKGAVLAAALALFVGSFALANWSAIDTSYDSSIGVVAKALASGHPLGSLREAIGSGTVPNNTNIRLMLWHNAIEVWSRNVLFGNGIAWRDIYESTRYASIGFDIVHNGYLEIGMRYGFLGLGFYAVLYGWSMLKARRAVQRRLIPTEAYRFHVVSIVFFFATILTNSNNRLAIGEAFMLTAAAFGFYCFYLVQKQDHDARNKR
jgi:O-antigen ligase